MYLSYESLSNNFVYFDDMKITHTRSKVIQYNACLPEPKRRQEYYPFGMQTANSWTRENNTGNNFLANSGTELNATSNLYDLDYRQYDPVLGRLNGIDPMATKYASLSPYNFSFNDPVTFSDPSGADPNQRSDDTWWVANRESLYGSRYAGFSSAGDLASLNSGFYLATDPWGWTGMSSGALYGPSFSVEGAGIKYGGPSKEMEADAKAVREGKMELSDYAAKYGSAPTPKISAVLESRNLASRNNLGQLGFWRYSGLDGAAGVEAKFIKFNRQPLDEKAHISFYRPRGKNVDWVTLTLEYKTGFGPERSVFYQDHPVVQAMKNSYVVREAKRVFERGGEIAIYFEDIDFNWWNVPGAGYNMTEQFIGSARVSIIPQKDGRIMYQIDNTTDRNSGSLDKATKSVPRDPNHLTPNGTIYQRLIWWE